MCLLWTTPGHGISNGKRYSNGTFSVLLTFFILFSLKGIILCGRLGPQPALALDITFCVGFFSLVINTVL